MIFLLKKELEKWPETEQQLFKWVEERMESSQVVFPTK